MRQLGAGVVLITAGLVAMPATAQEAVVASPFRYDDDSSAFAGRDDLIGRIKNIALGSDADVSFGGDVRERVEASTVTALGVRYGHDQVYDLHRALLHADLELDQAVRVFMQLGNESETGRKPGSMPLDIDRLDLAQGFIDVDFAAAAGRVTLRAGRAEISFDDGALIGLRDGPNVRQSWDGGRATYRSRELVLDVFAVRPVDVRGGIFDDRAVTGQALQGVHLTATPSRHLEVDTFYYRNVNASVVLFGFTGHERTDTLGVRVRGAGQGFDGSLGAIVQGGDAEWREVRAFAVHADAGASFGGLPFIPHIGVRADVLSGGGSSGRHIATFNALYPNVAYSTEATIEAPANLVQVGAVATITPARAVTLQYTLEGLWRYSSRDAFYTAPLFPLLAPGADHDRFSGIEQQLRAVWRPGRVLTLTTAIVHFAVGNALRRSGARDETFAMTSVALQI